MGVGLMDVPRELGGLWPFIHHLDCDYSQHLSDSVNNTHRMKGETPTMICCLHIVVTCVGLDLHLSASHSMESN